MPDLGKLFPDPWEQLSPKDADTIATLDALTGMGFPRAMVERAITEADAEIDKVFAIILCLNDGVTEYDTLRLCLFLGGMINHFDQHRPWVQIMLPLLGSICRNLNEHATPEKGI